MKTSKMCKVSGGNLPGGFEAKVDVTIDYEGVSHETIAQWATSHMIINVQRVLRNKTTRELDELAKSGYETMAITAGRGTTDPVKAYKSTFSEMTREEQDAQIAELEEMRKEASDEDNENDVETLSSNVDDWKEESK